MWGRYQITGTAAMYGSNHAIRMDTLKKIGYYGTKTITEDAEITTKMWKEGYKISMCPKSSLLVEAVSSVGALMRERKRWNGGTIDAMMKAESKGLSLTAGLTGVNALIWVFSLVSLLLSFLNPLFLISFFISAFAMMLTMISFKARFSLMLWIIPFLVVWGPLNLISVLLAAKDHFFGAGVRWVKVEGEHYHKGVKMRSPIR
jgi:cellulose synthase/poly-beta-1,6-N-acetylglucosamine synthase-like glycosyltransferase